jgi:hypothetical protein
LLLQAQASQQALQLKAQALELKQKDTLLAQYRHEREVQNFKFRITSFM